MSDASSFHYQQKLLLQTLEGKITTYNNAIQRLQQQYQKLQKS